jgi:hypothetical protein
MHIAIALPVPQGSSAPTLPSWADAPEPAGPEGAKIIASVTLKGYRYSLRTVRRGYIYVFFKKNQNGSNKWQTWEVGIDGQAYPINPEWGTSVAGLPCHRKSESDRKNDIPTLGHSAQRLHHIVIDAPHKCETAWLAFSEHHWSMDTLKRYQTDASLREKRMLRFEPAQLIASDTPSSSCMTYGCPEAFLRIGDYALRNFSELPHDASQGSVPPISKNDKGDFDTFALTHFHSTRYPWATQRQFQAEQAARWLASRSKKTDDSPHPGVVVALRDPIGCAHELNGYRNDIAGCVRKYSDERGLQIGAANGFDGLRLALQQRALDDIERPWKWSVEQSANRWKHLKSDASAEAKELERDLCRRWEQDAAARVPARIVNRRDVNIAFGRERYMSVQQEIDRGVTQYLRKLKNNPQISQYRNAYAEQIGANQFQKYQDRIDTKALNNFKSTWDTFLKAASDEIDQRTAQLVSWLKAPAFINVLEDFSPITPNDGACFEDVIGTAIMGMGSSISGARQIDAWVLDLEIKPSNLLWRALAQNQTSGIEHIQKILEKIYTPGSLDSSSAHASNRWAALALDIKWNKVADLGKKSLTFFNTNQKAMNDAKSGIDAVKETRGLDKILATTGHRMLKPLAKVADIVNELALQTFLTVRSGAEPSAALALADTQLKYQGIERNELVQRLRSNQNALSDAARARQVELAKRWQDLRLEADMVDAKKGNYNAVRDARLALVVGLFEALNLYKISEQLGGDQQNAQLQMQLKGAMLATASSVLDMVSNLVKGGDDLKDKAISYQRLKFVGGGLGVAASVYGLLIDLNQAATANSQHDYRAMVLHDIRALFQGISAFLTGLTALSYCSPSILAFGERHAARFVGEVALKGGTRLLSMRAALTLASLEVSIFVFFVSAVIYAFEPDALEKWCDNSAFGKERHKNFGAYTKPQQQESAFVAAFIEAA